MPVPAAVRNAMYALYAIAALVVLRVILTIAFSDSLVDKWLESNASAAALPREIAVETFTPPAYVPISFIALAVATVLVVAAVFLAKGAGWARIVAIVFAAIQIVAVLVTFVAPYLPVLHVVNVTAALLSVAVIVLLSSAEAREFCGRRKITS